MSFRMISVPRLRFVYSTCLSSRRFFCLPVPNVSFTLSLSFYSSKEDHCFFTLPLFHTFRGIPLFVFTFLLSVVLRFSTMFLSSLRTCLYNTNCLLSTTSVYLQLLRNLPKPLIVHSLKSRYCRESR